MSNASPQNDGSAPRPEDPQCYVCGRSVGDHWFSRICLGQTRICLCSPACSILYSAAPTPPADPEARKRFYRDQDQLLRDTEATGHFNSYDTTLAHAAY